jgi:peroxiredoxin
MVVSRTILRGALAAVAIGLIFVAGIHLGRVARRSDRALEMHVDESDLEVGARVPHVVLVAASGDTLATEALVAGRGRVLVFVDPACPSCRDASRRWQRLIDAGALPPDTVAGVTSAPAEESETYRRNHGLSFPIYQDVRDVFRRTYHVTTYPYEVVVGASGSILSTTSDTRRPIDVDDLRAQLSQR